MTGKNVNYGINYGHIGDQLNIYQYRTSASFKEILGDGGANNSIIGSGQKNILVLELFSRHADNLKQEFQKEKLSNKYPLKIRVTQLVDDCAQGVYYNDGNINNDVWQIVDSIVTLFCASECGSNFYANRVRVGKQFYYELYPLKNGSV